MNPLIVADESVDFAIITLLRGSGFEVLAIVEDHASWSDDKVLDLAFRKEAYLITEDKDFGELTYRFQKPSHGILLVRLPMEESEEKAAMVLEIIQFDFERLWKKFAVLEPLKLRVRPMNL
jgi:predicted nuclease of predicted toxin-antitoxin system